MILPFFYLHFRTKIDYVISTQHVQTVYKVTKKLTISKDKQNKGRSDKKTQVHFDGFQKNTYKMCYKLLVVDVALNDLLP